MSIALSEATNRRFHHVNLKVALDEEGGRDPVRHIARHSDQVNGKGLKSPRCDGSVRLNQSLANMSMRFAPGMASWYDELLLNHLLRTARVTMKLFNPRRRTPDNIKESGFWKDEAGFCALRRLISNCARG